MNSLDKALERSAGISEMARTEELTVKSPGFLGASVGDSYVPSTPVDSRFRYRYDLFRGWLFSAINAIAEKGAGQGVNVGRFANRKDGKTRQLLMDSKSYLLHTMPNRTKSRAMKYPSTGIEVLQSSPLLDALEQPNEIQGRWQFVYSFVANLALTGWSYIIIDTNDEGKLQFFSIPTTWVTPVPDEKGNPFGKFVVRNPKRGDAEGTTYTKDQIAFAYLPNPSDPLAALSPATAQMDAIVIDDKIQTSQGAFFENGIFPSVVIKVGSNPHPEIQAGIRPRLTNAQRQQLHNTIRRLYAGVSNYGRPAIVDGYIESVSRLSATQNEMGWEKSEGAIRTRILSAYAVHPYMLGEPVGVGGYAQVAGIERVFCGKVNTYLDMLGNILSNVLMNAANDDKILIWWDKCEPLDPSIRNKMLEVGRKNNDVTRNEFRAEMGLPPMEEGSDRSRLVGDQVAMSSLLNVLGKQGLLNEDSLAELLKLFLGVTEEEARVIAGGMSTDDEGDVLEEIRQVALELKKPVRLELPREEAEKEADRLLSFNDDDDDTQGALVPQ